jgi:hypothetical protein
MNRNVVCIVVVLMVIVTPMISAQEEKEENGHVFTIKTYEVQFQNIDTVLELWEKMWKPVYTKNEHVKSFRVFTHLNGSDWTIVIIVEYESLSGIEATRKRGKEIRKEMFPDEGKWRAAVAEVQGMYRVHSDDIVKEVPNLRKMMAVTIHADESKEPDPTGIYTLVEVDGNTVPTTISHGAELRILSGTFTITADKTCKSKITFRLPSDEEFRREVDATYTQNGSKLLMKWEGAGRTEGTIKGDTFTMNNEGMLFFYKKKPVED